jgi:hypothetical protein
MTKEKFKAYLAIQRSGIINMFDVIKVIALSLTYAPDSRLTRDDCLAIMKNYGYYEKKYSVTTETLDNHD